MERDISVQAQHLAGKLNETADEESRVMKDRSDWMLCPEVFKTQSQAGPTNIRELEARHGGNGHRCLHARLEGNEGSCQPTMERGGQGTAQVQQQEADLILVAPI